MENPQTIQDEITKIRMERYFRDMTSVYKKLEIIVKDELDTSLIQFLTDYAELSRQVADNVNRNRKK